MICQEEGRDKNNVKFLVSCRKNLEGFDTLGVDISCVSFNANIEPYRLLQITGRSMRVDYPNKIANCLVFKESNNTDEKVEDIIYNLYRQLIEDMDLKDKFEKIVREGKIGNEIKKFIEDFIGEIIIDEKTYSSKESIEFIQKLYLRNEIRKTDDKIKKYDLIVKHNKKCGFTGRDDYIKRKEENADEYVETPDIVYKEKFVNWYSFLGIDEKKFYDEKEFLERIKKCRSGREYLELTKVDDKLPKEYAELFPNIFKLLPWNKNRR
jgi:hypothetical protein